MKTALITGVTGQDGSYLAELLLEKGYRVIGIKRRTSLISTDRVDHLIENSNFKMRYGSMHDPSWMYSILSEYEPDEVYNLAAQSHVRVSFETPIETADCVAMGTLRLLEACRHSVPKVKFYQASSSEMYGDNPEYPQNEQTAFRPASPYACAKLFAHNLCRHYREAYGMFCCAGILFNHESPHRGETFVTRKITMAAAKIKFREQETLWLGNLEAKRDWGHARDYVRAMWMMLQHTDPDDYVVATGTTHSVREFLNTVFDIAVLDPSLHVKIDKRFFRPHEVPILLGDATKIKETLGWEPKFDFMALAGDMFWSDWHKVETFLKAQGKNIPVEAYLSPK
ncbi:MAG TPA: GDP-mannose 4,6-dehydratase [Gemmatimonadetes bacterium]|nr:GDP-mannose 4,6-dehydratase [Gemmatimonadota bacterium]